jgi:hypothetical protein
MIGKAWSIQPRVTLKKEKWPSLNFDVFNFFITHLSIILVYQISLLFKILASNISQVLLLL